MELQPLDIVLVHGLWYNPLHWAIRWRSLDKCVHCFTICNYENDGYNPLFTNVQLDNLSKYTGREVTIVRHRDLHIGKINTICKWLELKYKKSKKYDFFKQWLLGFVFGIAVKSLVNDENAWTCSELPYWMFQENGVKLTSVDEALPLPRLFKYHNDFDIIFEGKLTV